MRTSISRFLQAVVAVVLVIPAAIFAQQPSVTGIVTTLQGSAELTRPSQPLPASLRFKDNVYVRDVINTKEKSLVRVLFGGKSTVTVRELSRLEVREETLPGGATRSIHELSSGAILVNVAKQLMRPGDEVQIRTPNAVAAVRGTIVYVESGDAATNRPSSFTVLTGNVDVTPHGGNTVNLIANTRTSVTGNILTGTRMGAVTPVPPAQVNQILQQFEPRLTLSYEAGQRQTGETQSAQATQLARAVVTTITGVDPGTTPQVIETAQLLPAPGEGVTPPHGLGPLGIPNSTTTAPITPTLPPAAPPPPPMLPSSLAISGGITDFSSGINPAFVDANISGGTLTGSDRVTVNGLTTWNGGAMMGTGSTAALGGMEIGGSGTKSLDARTLSTLGTVNLTGGKLALTNGALLSSAGAFNNSASLDVNSATALLQGGGTSTGNFNVGSGGSLLFNGGIIT